MRFRLAPWLVSRGVGKRTVGQPAKPELQRVRSLFPPGPPGLPLGAVADDPCEITCSHKRGLYVSVAQARRLHTEASVFPRGAGCVGCSFLPLRARGAAPVGRTSHGASKICEKQPRNAPNAQANTKANIVGEGQGRPAREVRRGPEGGPGEPPERDRKGSTDKKRFPHLRAVRNQEEPSRNQAAFSRLLPLDSLIWPGLPAGQEPSGTKQEPTSEERTCLMRSRRGRCRPTSYI